MIKNVLIVAATSAESEVVGLPGEVVQKTGGFSLGDMDVSILVAGVGSYSTSWEMQKWIAQNGKPGLALNIGIAGSYNQSLVIGDVVMPVTDCFADAGIEDGSRFLSIYEAGLAGPDAFPFRNGRIHAGQHFVELLKDIARPVNAITVNTATGSDSTRDKLFRKYKPDIETMEGATFFYICSREGIPFTALRAVSNMVEPRDKRNWDIKLALTNLAKKLEQVLLILNS